MENRCRSPFDPFSLQAFFEAFITFPLKSTFVPRGPCVAAALAALVLAGSWHPAFALDGNRRLSQCLRRVWQVQQGLPQATIFCIRQTKDGYLWLGTQTGLVRFDGVQFTSIRGSEDASLENRWIRDLAEDSDGRLWVATDGGGLFCVDQARVLHYGPNDGLPSDSVRAVFVDRDRAVWAGTDRGAARLLDGQFVAAGNDSAPVGALCQTSDGTIWTGGRGNRISSFRDGGWTDHTIAELPADASVSALLASPDKAIWIGTSDGLVRYQRDHVERFTRASGLADNRVYDLASGQGGVLWIGTKDGFSRYEHGEFESFRSRDGLAQSTVYTLWEDREGSLWVGTKHGLNQFVDRRTIPFTTSEGLPSNNAGPVLEDRDGVVWVGTLDAGLARYDGRHFSAVTREQGLPSDCILALAADQKTPSLWVGTDHGLCRLEAGRVVKTYTTHDGLPADVVRAICRGPHGTLWVGTPAGIAEFEGGRFRVPDAQSHSDPPTIQALANCPWGLLAAASGGKLYRCRDQKIEAFSAPGLASVDADALYSDADGLLWIGTRGSGLLRFDGEKAVAFTIQQGLYDDDIFGIVGDNRGLLWVACSKGIFSIEREQLQNLAAGRIRTLSCRPFSPTDAQRTVECTEGAQPCVWRMRDGRIWFSTIHGLIVIDPEHLQRHMPPNSVVIEDMFVNGQSQSLEAREPLPPGQNNLEFHYTALSFVSPARIAFRYRLEGFDRDWIDAGSRREAFYTNLPPGDYRFRVVAEGLDGTAEAANPLAFTVLPHLYQRKWFIPLCVLAAGLVVLIWVQMRIRQVRTQMRAVLAERTRIARELHDTLMQGFSGVTMEMQALAARIPASPERRTLDEIIRDAGVCLREARQSLMGLRTARREPTGLAADIGQAARQMADARNIRLKLRLHDAPRWLSPDMQYNLLRIAKEAVSNAVRHSGAASIEVALDCSPRQLALSVKDDGMGLDGNHLSSADAGHFGIVGMRERASDIGARFELTSRPGHGTTVSVVLPSPPTRASLADGHPSG